MRFRFSILGKEIRYTGVELTSGWVKKQTGLDGDAAAGFVGNCSVPTENLVDLDDRRAGATIESAEMAHVLIEHPGCSIRACVLRQRLLVCLLCDILRGRGVSAARDGDDVHIGRRKLTVSIAAPSTRSCLIHLGINVRPEGAPVPAVGLEELRINAKDLLQELLGAYKNELETAAHAEKKVRTVE
jgi:hypothetical protein